ncbi:hypothetical protein H9P43_004468 [Blastocladiella emersonii ATCC 22665]|nr:hypothetical protein H9P43_004468 [Blastocladiella emersonii ATCC 22665]
MQIHTLAVLAALATVASALPQTAAPTAGAAAAGNTTAPVAPRPAVGGNATAGGMGAAGEGIAKCFAALKLDTCLPSQTTDLDTANEADAVKKFDQYCSETCTAAMGALTKDAATAKCADAPEVGPIISLLAPTVPALSKAVCLKENNAYCYLTIAGGLKKAGITATSNITPDKLPRDVVCSPCLPKLALAAQDVQASLNKSLADSGMNDPSIAAAFNLGVSFDQKDLDSIKQYCASGSSGAKPGATAAGSSGSSSSVSHLVGLAAAGLTVVASVFVSAL